MKADLKMINSAPCIGAISVSHWEDCWDKTGWTTACQACATCCPEPDWLMGRIIHLMALSWHSSLLSSLFSPGTSRSAGCWLSPYLQTHTESKPQFKQGHMIFFPQSPGGETVPTLSTPSWFSTSSHPPSLRPTLPTYLAMLSLPAAPHQHDSERAWSSQTDSL